MRLIKTFQILSVLALTLPDVTSAQEAAPIGGGVAAYRLKTRSVFSGPEDARSPFWPIGWSPSKGGGPEATTLVAPKIEIDESQFALTSVIMGNPSLAVINGRAYSEGEFIRRPRGDKAVAAKGTLRVKIQRIQDGTVVLESQGQTVTVQMRRPELQERKPVKEEPLSSEEE